MGRSGITLFAWAVFGLAAAGLPARSEAAGGSPGPGPGAGAPALQITPVRLELKPGQRAATITVTNEGTEEETVQLRPFQWDQAGGEDNLSPTRLLAVSPPITGIAAVAAQVFRVVLRQPPGSVESSYRLLFDQLPPPAAPGEVRMALRFSVPVFAEPSVRPEKDIAWSVVLDREGAMLTGTNHGTSHVRILDPELSVGGGPAFAVRTSGIAYLLPGAARRWRIEKGARLPAGSIARLTANSDQGPVDAAVHVSGP